MHGLRMVATATIVISFGLCWQTAGRALGADASTARLQLEVSGFASDQGSAMIALFDNEAAYSGGREDVSGAVRRAQLPIEDGRCIWQLDHVLYGHYAIRLYHDENSNGELDTNLFGIPSEGVGVSNDASITFGLPDFKDAQIAVDRPSLTIQITIQ